MAPWFKPKLVDISRKAVVSSSPVRRLLWRASRWLYCVARGEQGNNDMRFNGEYYLQARVVDAARPEQELTIFDVGANRGEWTVALLKDVKKRRPDIRNLKVHAFEPTTTTRVFLTDRLVAEGFSGQVEVAGAAASDRSGNLRMAVMSPTGGTNSLVFDKTMETAALGFIEVPLVTLDQYCLDRGIRHIQMAKCDTEGNDLNVMRGASRLLSAGAIDVFQFEYNHCWVRAGAFLKDVFELSDGLPYRVGRIMPDHVELFDSWHPELERFYQSNYVLVKETALSWFEARSGTFDQSNTYA
ncbi:FkbM family methyltransferase [Mesorhizobium sp. L48C026A00]|uniref:FkbM family methyltransferase n=1 Tax=Mesorhizobium sp. L48C026A00 TaxID=1287182 RepID=UPI0018DC697D|nr:FkbM family methyltransferase [Mesorhizobium sp. L48C026A00]